MHRLALALTILLAGCGTTEDRFKPSILHYVRSNQDGTEAETVVQFRPTPMDIAVYKARERCTTAAYVTAHMANSREAGRYVAGKVARDGSQAAFGTLELKPDGQLEMSLNPPGVPRLTDRFRPRLRPFVIYDFDFADLNASLQLDRRRNSFRYALPVLWPTTTGFGFRDLGILIGRLERFETHNGLRSKRFALRVEGPQPAAGTLWAHAEKGFIIDALLSIPNHQEYRDFRLRLVKEDPGGQEDWDKLTRAHYRDCATGQ
ncbi:hypothetical protein G7077_04160 [Sphingomonas piscis]|uniref:Lipoprotein n=1 Tax=Sphingomonas piscis TaxID=2714943 RepID=A0A6G7YNB9_9SPHN|nr:hypothetical protein [Sphingomonas piscis]QIK78216.1 hypothetical protein G7077_04160 [Sphingomonas piscis]